MLRIGVIGCGPMGINHIQRITERIQGACVTAVSNRTRAHAEEAARIAGGTRIYDNGTELINDPEVDAVLIASAGFLHTQDLLEAIRAGKRVFCEKPLFTTEEDCRTVMEAEMKTGRHLIQVGFCRRYYTGYRQLKEAVETGKYGEPLMIHMTHRAQRVALTYDTPMMVHDTCVHDLDICHWMLGEAYDSVQVFYPKETKNTHPGLRDPQLMMLRTKSGVLIDVEVNVNCSFGYDMNMEVICEDASLKMGMPIAPEIKTDARKEREIPVHHFVLFAEAFDAEIQDWVDHAADDRITGPDTWDGYFAAVTCDALVRAQETGLPEPVCTMEKPAFYMK